MINMENQGKQQRQMTPQKGLIGETDSLFDRENQYSILHIDDDQNTLRLSKYFLEQVCSVDNLIVDSESDSTKIHSWLNNDHDCYIIDYSMPVNNGLAVCKEIRALKDTPIILFTSMEKDDIPIDSFNALNVKYHQKSSNPENYFHLTDSILDLVRSDLQSNDLAKTE